MKLVLLMALIGASLANGCQYLCLVDDENLLCTWACHVEDDILTLKFKSPDTGCVRDSFFDCVSDDRFNNMCYLAGGCNADLKFGSAFECLDQNPGDLDCLQNNGLVYEEPAQEDLEIALVQVAEEQIQETDASTDEVVESPEVAEEVVQDIVAYEDEEDDYNFTEEEDQLLGADLEDFESSEDEVFQAIEQEQEFTLPELEETEQAEQVQAGEETEVEVVEEEATQEYEEVELAEAIQEEEVTEPTSEKLEVNIIVPEENESNLAFMNWIVLGMIAMAVIYGIWKEVSAKNKTGKPVLPDASFNARNGSVKYAQIREEDLQIITNE